MAPLAFIPNEIEVPRGGLGEDPPQIDENMSLVLQHPPLMKHTARCPRPFSLLCPEDARTPSVWEPAETC